MLDLVFLYIDPGTLSAISAAIIGVLVGGGMLIKTKWQQILYKLKK